MATATIRWQPFSPKHKYYIRQAVKCQMSVAEGAIRSGKTIDNCIVACRYLEDCPDRIHLASGSTIANAKMNIGDCNGFGLEHLFRGRCRWGKYKDNEALYIQTRTGEKIVIFAGGGKADSFKKFLVTHTDFGLRLKLTNTMTPMITTHLLKLHLVDKSLHLNQKCYGI